MTDPARVLLELTVVRHGESTANAAFARADAAGGRMVLVEYNSVTHLLGAS